MSKLQCNLVVASVAAGLLTAGPADAAFMNGDIIDGNGPVYVNNGSFETFDDISGVTDPDQWESAFNGDNDAVQPDNIGGDGDQNLHIRGDRGAAINTGHVVAADERYDLSFLWGAKFLWDDDDQIDWRLFTTSDNTRTGTVDLIAQDFVSGGGTQTVMFMNVGTVDTSNIGQDLWLEFFSSNADDDENARLDNVNLRVASPPIPEPATAALLATGTLLLTIRRWGGR